jgi:membrane-bound ClpP family serine protease
MTPTLLIIVLVLGVLLFALEIVALPGGIAGAFGLLLTGFGVWQSYLIWGPTIGNTILCICAGIIIVLLAIFLKAKTWKRFSLDEESDSVVNQVDQAALAVGARGTTVARLAPTGKALFDGQLVEVHAINKFIDPDRPIEVVAVDGYRIDVCEVADTRFDKPQD